MAMTQFINGDVTLTGAAAMWNVIAMWIAAGATKLADSDGTTYSSSGVQVTSGSAGAGGLGNTSAWVRIRFLDGREVTIQRGSSGTSWRFQYSAIDHFTGGSPGATQTPSAADGVLRFGGGTNASPTYNALFTSDATYKLYGGAGGAADGWWFGTVVIAGGAASGGMYMDPLPAPTTDDDDGCVIGIGVSGASFTKTNISNNSAAITGAGVFGWLKYGLAGSGYVAIPALVIGDSAGDMWPLVAGTNPHTTKDAIRLIEYGRKSSLAAPAGPKGVSAFVAWNASSRSTLETYSIGSTRDRIIFGDVNFPWSGAVVL